MTRLEKKLRAVLRQLNVGEESKVLVAVSGGADSVALLDAFVRLRSAAKMPKKIFAAHLNHGLRGAESDADQVFVDELAARLETPAILMGVTLSVIGNIEAAAREARYDFLAEAAVETGADVVATAHTRDDQVETIVMRLLRGTSGEGLRGIHRAAMLAAKVRLIRPLLDVTRAEVIAYCEHYGVAFRTDSSNFSTDFTRNRVRHELLPQLKTYNPRIDEALLRLSRQMTEDDDYLNEIAADLSGTVASARKLELKLLREQPPAIRRRALRLWLRRARGDLRRIGASHLLSLDQLVTQGAGGSYVELPGGWQVWRRRGHLVLVKAGSKAVESAALQEENQPCPIGNHEYL